MKRTRLALALLTMLVASTAQGLIVKQSVEQMLAESSDVVQGHVVSKSSRWTEDGRTIVTDVAVDVSESWIGKRSAGTRINLIVLGGEVGDRGVRYEHQPDFAPGEEVVLFVGPSPELTRQGLGVVNFAQGKYSVARGLAVGLDLTPRPLADFKREVQDIAFREEGPR